MKVASLLRLIPLSKVANKIITPIAQASLINLKVIMKSQQTKNIVIMVIKVDRIKTR